MLVIQGKETPVFPVISPNLFLNDFVRPRAHASERKRRGSVSAPPMGAISQKFLPKVFPKEPEVAAWLKVSAKKYHFLSQEIILQ